MPCTCLAKQQQIETEIFRRAFQKSLKKGFFLRLCTFVAASLCSVASIWILNRFCNRCNNNFWWSAVAFDPLRSYKKWKNQAAFSRNYFARFSHNVIPRMENIWWLLIASAESPFSSENIIIASECWFTMLIFRLSSVLSPHAENDHRVPWYQFTHGNVARTIYSMVSNEKFLIW